MKTPEQIAEKIVQPNDGSNGMFNMYLGHQTVYNVEDHHAAHLRNAIIKGIEVDRAQRENDGTIHAAVIAALHDRAEGFGDDDANTAASAAQWIEDDPDSFWEQFAGPMLDEIERAFR